MTTPAASPLPSRRRSAAGFTLIEVMISLLIFSLGVLGTVALQARAAQFASQNGNRSQAALLANEMVTSLWSFQSATPDPTYLAAWKTRVAAAGSGLPNATSKVTTAGNTATVQIWWKGPSIAAAAASAAYATTVVIQ